MNNQVQNAAGVQIFNSPGFGEIRAQSTDKGDPLFCLTDVRKILGLTHVTELRKRLNQKGCITIAVSTPIVSQGVNTGKTKTMQLTFVNEPNLYRCIFQSRKKEAEAFQDWVYEEIMPSIRKYGGYMVPVPEETAEETLARALLLAQKTIEAATARVEYLYEQNRLQTEQLQIAAPKIAYYNTVLMIEGTYDINIVAEELGMSGIKLNKILKEKKVLYRQGGQWLLYSKYQDKGYTKTRTYIVPQNNGEINTRLETVWTKKGKCWIHELLNKPK